MSQRIIELRRRVDHIYEPVEQSAGDQDLATRKECRGIEDTSLTQRAIASKKSCGRIINVNRCGGYWIAGRGDDDLSRGEEHGIMKKTGTSHGAGGRKFSVSWIEHFRARKIT